MESVVIGGEEKRRAKTVREVNVDGSEESWEGLQLTCSETDEDI